MNHPASSPATPAPRPPLAEVRYSLPEMLAELQVERAGTAFAMEKLDQAEIGKLFKAKAVRRAKSKK